MDTPYQWTKQVASHWGGTRNGTIVHWPSGHRGARARCARQFHHVIDVAPTVLEAAGLPEPTTVHGVAAEADRGRQHALRRSTTRRRRSASETQYFEMFCNRGIYHQGWTAVTRHSTPWVVDAELPPFADDTWELYDTEHRLEPGARPRGRDAGEARRSCKALFMEEARKYNVLPLDDRRVERFNSDLAGRPALISGNSQLLFGGMGRLQRERRRSTSRTSRTRSRPSCTCPRAGAEGVIIAQGGAFAGWSLYVEGRAAEVLLQPVRPSALLRRGRNGDPPGTHQVPC